MKKLLLTLAMAAFAALGAASAYAFSSCEDWSFSDSRCSEYIHSDVAGKAAFGTPTGQEGRLETVGLACDDWSYNDPGCSAYLGRDVTGKAAYGRMTGEEKPAAVPLCFDWSFNAACRDRNSDEIIN